MCVQEREREKQTDRGRGADACGHVQAKGGAGCPVPSPLVPLRPGFTLKLELDSPASPGDLAVSPPPQI